MVVVGITIQNRAIRRSMCYRVGIMQSISPLTRRSFLALSAASPLIAAKKRPVGLELFSVRNELQKDLEGTLQAVAKAGYDGVEFSPRIFPGRRRALRKSASFLTI